jgi:crotonobetainyl-CoA:carnitine CoA-transferase CaiB-like acyl-CoA transferase
MLSSEEDMTEEIRPDFLLDNYRVLDLTDDKAYLCGKILADLGADVIKIEKPGGDPGRMKGPFVNDIPDPQRSLHWFAFNVNKRSITLDIETGAGARIFQKLVEKADFVIESYRPGYLDGINLGYATISTVNPAIIMTSITPFGNIGPHKAWAGSDIVWMATGGFMGQAGDDDRPPVRISIDQASLHACAEGVVASLIADYERQNTGTGNHIDVSVQASVLVSSFSAVPFWNMDNVILNRSGAFRVGLRKGGKGHRQQWNCKDGFVSYAMLGGMAGASSNRALVEWMESVGYATDVLRQMEWTAYDIGTADDELVELLEGPVARFFLAYTKEELYRGALEKRVLLYPVYDVAEIIDSPQLESRGFWVQVEHPELGTTIKYPGPISLSSEVTMSVYRRPPLIGEHNEEIYSGELGFSSRELTLLAEAKVI